MKQQRELYLGILMANMNVNSRLHLVFYIIILKNLEKSFKNIYNGDTLLTLDNIKHIKGKMYGEVEEDE